MIKVLKYFCDWVSDWFCVQTVSDIISEEDDVCVTQLSDKHMMLILQ